MPQLNKNEKTDPKGESLRTTEARTSVVKFLYIYLLGQSKGSLGKIQTKLPLQVLTLYEGVVWFCGPQHHRQDSDTMSGDI